ncbi:MAG: D-alanyl-D-alanine carboxypeptidase family protein [Blautia sp.]
MTNKLKILILCWLLLLLGAAFLHKQEVKDDKVWVKGESEVSLEQESQQAKETSAGEWSLTADSKSTNGDRPENLYALSAVLMDGKTGRVLFGKDSDVARPMASTTKVMTCILALENARGDEIVECSAKAAAQPDVQLNMIEGEQFYLEDLLYSLMLKSHNDTAVAVAEHIGGSVEGFAKMMNEKAKSLGCKNTHFVTPNGLDDFDEGGVHSTTAEDLAKIMSYAIQNETFLKITQTRDYSFWDLDHKRQFQVTNANAFLDMMDGVLSGKTGFTADAGYCYVCALERDDRIFVVALLGCGWPSHKTYKWEDTRKLLEYGLSHYENRALWQEPSLAPVPVEDAVPPDGELGKEAQVELVCEHTKADEQLTALLDKEEQVQVKYRLPKKLSAPVKEGQEVGQIQYYLDGKVLYQFPVKTAEGAQKLDFPWCVQKIFHCFFQEA